MRMKKKMQISNTTKWNQRLTLYVSTQPAKKKKTRNWFSMQTLFLVFSFYGIPYSWKNFLRTRIDFQLQNSEKFSIWRTPTWQCLSKKEKKCNNNRFLKNTRKNECKFYGNIFSTAVLRDRPTKVKFFDCWADDIAGPDKERWKVIGDTSQRRILR